MQRLTLLIRYQIEGASTEDSRGPCIWDKFAATPGKVLDATDGSVACDSYHRGAEDIALLKSLGAKAYRFSIAWPRIVPLGGRDDPVNQKGIDHYVQFVDDLLAADLIPVVTLYHVCQWTYSFLGANAVSGIFLKLFMKDTVEY